MSTRLGHATRSIAVAAIIIAAALAGSTSVSATSSGSSKQTTSCVSGVAYKRTLWTPAPSGQPAQIAPFGHLQANDSVVLTDTAVTSKGACVANVQVYLAFQVGVPGDSLTINNPSQCGGVSQLTVTSPLTWVTCITDTNGQVNVTYTAPSAIPARGGVEINDCISQADETPSLCGGYPPNYSTISFRDWYQYLMTYQFTQSPIAGSGSLRAGQSAPVTLQAAGVDGTPQMNTTVYLAETGSLSGIATVNSTSTALTGTFQPVQTDSNGQTQLTYTAPTTLPLTGVDNIVAQSDATASPKIVNTTSYAYGAGFPTVSIGNATTTEGDRHPNISAFFELTLSPPQATNVTVKYFTICGVGDKECREDIQEVKTPKSITIVAGQTSVAIPITNYSYSSLEPYNETYLVQIAMPTGAILGRSIGTGQLLGDDESTLAAYLYMGGGDVVVGSGTQTARVVVVLSSPLGSAVSFDYTTNDGSAVAGVDYTAESGTMTIPAGSDQATILVPILPHAGSGPTRIFTMGMSKVSGPAAIRLATGLVSILNIS